METKIRTMDGKEYTLDSKYREVYHKFIDFYDACIKPKETQPCLGVKEIDSSGNEFRVLIPKNQICAVVWDEWQDIYNA